MRINFNKIINIKNIKDLNKFNINKPIYLNNYLFHYLIIFDKLDILKLKKFPIFKENEENLNGFFLAAKHNNKRILKYLIKTYPEYIYNKNNYKEQFINYMSSNSIIKILNLKLNWENLLFQKISSTEIIYDLLLSECTYDKLLKLFNIYKPIYNLNSLFLNNKLTVDNIINILKLFDSSIYNLRDGEDMNLIFPVISKNSQSILSFVCKKNIDANYYTMSTTLSPLMFAYLNNNLKITYQLWDYIKNDFNYTTLNKHLENIAHFLLKNKYYDELSINILTNTPSCCWHQHNINKVTPLYLLTKLDYEQYHTILINKEINLDIIINTLNNENSTLKKYLTELNNTNSLNWLKFLSNQKIYTEDTTFKIENYSYSHGNLFQAKFKDITLIILNIKKKYKNLFIPYAKDYSLKNLNIHKELSLKWPDSIFEFAPIFHWIICYEDEDTYWIHNNLNNLINSARRKEQYEFAMVYLSLSVDKIGLHANILIYDFKKMTIERFDPFGNTVYFDKNLDEILEEELCWNTGLMYLKPSDYIPVSGFQTISDELNPYNQKSGDFGGYCLAWCTWYLENRISNPTIDSKNLITKLIKKLSTLNISFNEYIRNYANKINIERMNSLLKVGINYKKISNIILDTKTNNLLNKYIIKKFD
jgi:hypothetical protein